VRFVPLNTLVWSVLQKYPFLVKHTLKQVRNQVLRFVGVLPRMPTWLRAYVKMLSLIFKI